MAVPSTGYRPLASCPRAAGWSAATLCLGTDRTIYPATGPSVRSSEADTLAQSKSVFASFRSSVSNPLGEPVVNRGEEIACFGAAAPVAAEPGEAYHSARFPELVFDAAILEEWTAP